jgi:hypothetical protein
MKRQMCDSFPILRVETRVSKSSQEGFHGFSSERCGMRSEILGYVRRSFCDFLETKFCLKRKEKQPLWLAVYKF